MTGFLTPSPERLRKGTDMKIHLKAVTKPRLRSAQTELDGTSLLSFLIAVLVAVGELLTRKNTDSG